VTASPLPDGAGVRGGRPWLALLLVGIALAAGIATPWFVDFDEAVYAEVARGMRVSGDWVRPQWNGRPFYEKPALFYWLTAALYPVVGLSPVAPRLVSLLATLAGLAVLAAEARRRHGPAAAEVAVWVAGAALLPFSLGRLGLLDALLTTALTVALLAFLRGLAAPAAALRRRWLAAGYVAAGVALATKGPVFPLLLGLVVLAEAVRRHRVLATLRGAGLAWGVPLLLAVGLPWYLLAYLADGRAVLAQFIGKHTLARAAVPIQGHGGPAWYYLPVLLLGLLPFSALIPGAIASLRRRPRGDRETGWQSLVWAGVVVLVFSLAATKLPQYVAPAVPAVALLLAWAATDPGAAWRRWSWRATALLGTALAGLVAAIPFVLERATELFGAGVLRTVPGLVCLPAPPGRYLLLLPAAVLAAGGIVAWRRGGRGDAVAALRVLGVTGALGFAAFWVGLGRLGQAIAIDPLVELARRADLALPADAPIHLVQLNHRVTPTLATGRRIVFLSGRREDDMARLAAALTAGAPARAIVPEAWWAEIAATTGGHALGRSCGLVLVGERPP